MASSNRACLSLLTAIFSYLIFSDGCCYGKLCALPWAVVYLDINSQMPNIGIPVHPVQVYESLACLILGFMLLHRKIESKFPLFLIGYSVIRFTTEFYRGDRARGENVLLNLTTSQLISLLVLLITIFIYIQKKRVAKVNPPSAAQ